MEEKKIATSIDILIRTGPFSHIQITKYGEKKITYSTPEEMTKCEDLLNEEVVSDIIRSMRALPDRLGKKTNAVAEVEEVIKKKIPEWLENGHEPNIANLAEEKFEANQAKASAKVEEIKSKASEADDFFGNTEDLFK